MLVFMGPINQCSLSSIDVWFKPTASMAMRGEKFGGDPRIGQSTDWGCSQRSLFLRSSGIRPTLWSQRERLPRTGTAHRKRTLDVCGLAWEAYMLCLSGFLLQGVHQFELS
jgi:hypothetical protein